MVGGIFCNLQKAFDCVSHILLTKLEFYGITGTSYKLIKSYLEARYQRVVLNNISLCSCFKWDEIKPGVPRESLLGPPPFLVYINDLPKISNDNSNIVLFADDTSTIIAKPKCTNFRNTVIKIFQVINSWFSTSYH